MSRDDRDGHCSGCRFWSEMIAKCEGGGGMQAYCLSQNSPHASQYTFGHQGCDAFKPNTLGAIDDPPNYGEETRRAYIEEEGEEAVK